jgi:hypothetical protein
MSFGLRHAFGMFLKIYVERQNFDENFADSPILTVMGTLLVPKNVAESGVSLGIGHFTEMLLAYGATSQIKASLKLSLYDSRPEIDLSRFSDSFQERKIEEILQKTGMEYDQFHWHFKENDGYPLSILEYWNWIDKQFSDTPQEQQEAFDEYKRNRELIMAEKKEALLQRKNANQ